MSNWKEHYINYPINYPIIYEVFSHRSGDIDLYYDVEPDDDFDCVTADIDFDPNTEIPY